MIDQFERRIDYMRLSITDRCNLRCTYCMPGGIRLKGHDDILSYEEILRVCKAAVSLGIVRFKITGGEPLVRLGCTDFITELKRLPGVEQVTITTNGILLPDNLDALCDASIDGINISLDTLCDEQYQELTGWKQGSASAIKSILEKCIERGIKTKVNTVLLAETFDSLPHMAALAAEFPIAVRFIELMPFGSATAMSGTPMDCAFRILQEIYTDLRPDNTVMGNGPARYFVSDKLKGRIGFIDAVSHSFCAQCNRVRLTATGTLKLCLSYNQETNLKELLRNSYSEENLRNALEESIKQKPQAHCFSEPDNITEQRTMNRIGG